MKHGKTQRIQSSFWSDELEITDELFRESAQRVQKIKGSG